MRTALSVPFGRDTLLQHIQRFLRGLYVQIPNHIDGAQTMNREEKQYNESAFHIHPSIQSVPPPHPPPKNQRRTKTHLPHLWKLSLRLGRERLKLGNQECAVLPPHMHHATASAKRPKGV